MAAEAVQGHLHGLGESILDRDRAELLAELVAVARTDPPRVRGPGYKPVGWKSSGPYRPVAPGVSEPTTRYRSAVAIDGEIELLNYWPDESAQLLVPVDEDPVAGSPEEDLGRVTSDLWTLLPVDGSTRLVTYVDLIAEEERPGGVNIRELFDKQLARVQPIIDAITSQVEQFDQDQLPTVVERLIETFVDRWGRHRHMDQQLVALPGDWWAEPIEIVEHEGATHESLRAGDTTGEMAAGEVIEVATPALPRYSITPASFDELLRVIRKWAQAVERYPAAFGQLSEDHLSDLVCATLNAALPHASRETFTRGGKADLFIQANHVTQTTSEQKVFICESKWWNGAKHAGDALDQLFGYLGVDDTDGVLLIFCDLQDAAAARQKALDYFTSSYDKLTVDPISSPSEWPVMRMPGKFGYEVRICLALVSLPPTGPTAEATPSAE